MTFYAISALVNGLTSLALAVFIFFKSRKPIINKTFILFCLSAVAWSLPYFFWQISKDAKSALFWSKALMAGAIFIPVFYLHFVMAFLYKIKEHKKLLIIVYIFALTSLIINFTPLFVKKVEPELSFSFWPKPGAAFHIFLVIWFYLIIYSAYLLIKRFKEASGVEKSQILYILVGTLIGYIGGSTNYFLWYGIPIKPYGNVLASVYVGTVAYAIIVHRLMDIKIVMRRSTVYLGSVLTMFVPAAVILSFVGRFNPEILTSVSLTILVLAVTVFPSVKNYFYHLANRYFFSSLYDSAEVIAGVSDKLRATLETGEVYNAISQTVADAFHSRTFGVLGYQPKTNEYFVLFNQGFSIGEQTRFPGNRVLQERFVEQSQPMVVEELKREADHQYQETLEMLVGFKVAVLVPLNIRDETLGLLVLGPKETRDMYNDEDLKTLGVIASQAAIAIKNAQLYEETKKFSQTLQKEVERQTAELQKAYADLKVLDKAKTEFISMASHQLRTPLSSIKGYISMLLEGSYGKIGGRARGKLENVFESNERLIRIVNDLLDISRIELGKMELEKAPAQMEDLIQSCCEEMKINAEKKGLEFTFKKPEKPLPKIAIDSLKIRQVILNLIDNAIRYTQEGKIEIGIKKTDSGIQLSVEDTGEGLTPKEQKDIFEGFTRGSAGLAHFIEGAGLGLYTAKKFLQLHRGKIWVESRGKGKGSTFFVELPVK